MATPNIHLGESFLDRLVKDTYGKNSLGELSTEQMNELDAYMKSDDFKTKSQNFRSTDKTKFEGSVDRFLGKDTEKSRFYQTALTNPDKIKYLIPKLTTSVTGNDRESTVTGNDRKTTVTATSTKKTSTRPVTVTSSTASSTTGASNETATEQSTQETPQFKFDSFASDQNLTDFKVIDGKKYVRYDPTGIGDFYIDESGKIYDATFGGGVGSEITSTPTSGPMQRRDQYTKLLQLLGKYKTGGKMNRVKYFQQGGPAQQQGAQDIQQQIVALVQAAMQGDEKANQTVTQIMEAAKAGDQQATQLAQMIQAVIQQMKGQATSAKWGSKLGYIRSLKYAQGGKTCPACEKGAPVKVEEKACGGKAKKAKKRYFGGWL